MFDRLRVWVPFLGLAVWGAGCLLAQAPVGSLTGTVHDTTGAVMLGVNVTVTNKDTGLERQMTTSDQGIFSAASLPAGNYGIKAAAAGFRTLEESATVQAGQVTSVDLVLQVGAESEVISVQGEAAQISYDSHEISGVITHQNIENLPLNGRNFLQLSMLEPGVTVAANNVGQYNKQFDVSILGASSANNSVRITVDGATVQDAITGGTQQNFSQEVVQEFQLSSTNFDLSTGIGAGGAVNVVTRSGGNDFHGSVFFFYRDHNISAFPTLGHEPGEPASPYFARKQEGFWFGGPIKKDKLFFFSSLEHIDQTSLFSAFPSDPLFQSFGTNAASPYHANELTERLDWRINTKNNAFLRYSHDGNNSFAPPGIGDLPSDWNVNTNWADSGVFSLISVMTPATANEFRYSYTFWSNSNLPPTLAQCPAPCLGWDYATNSDGPMITILGVNNFALGEAANAPQSRLLRRHIFADNVSSQKGTHAIKFGGYWEYQKGTGSYAYAQPAAMELWSPELVQAFNQKIAGEGYGAYQVPMIPSTFNTISNILQLPVDEFTIGVGNPTQPPLFQRGNADHDNLFHLYAEDTWKIRPRFSLNYGLAWSYESNALNHDLTKPAYLEPIFGASGLGYEQHSPRNFSPMLGFAWTVTKDNKTVVRGGSAIYYDTWDIFNRLIERVILSPLGVGRIPLPDSAFFGTISGILGFGGLPTAIQPTSLSSEPTNFRGQGLVNDLATFVKGAEAELNSGLPVQNVDLFKTGQGLIPQNFRLPYSEHASIGIQREVRSDLLISADFVFRQYMHQLITDADLNYYNSAAGPVIPKCGPGQALKVPEECSAGPIETEISGGRSHYKGLLLKADKRFSHRTTGTLAYAYASQVGYNGLVDNSNWFASWGPQAGHQTLTGSIVVVLPWGVQVSGISSFQSATPFQPFLTGVDLNGNGVFATAGESPFPGPPLPGGGFNEFGVAKNKADLIQLVNQFNQTYAGKTDPLGHPIPFITLPSNFTFPRSFNSQDLRVTKTFRLSKERWKLSVIGECFNVFNIANLTFYNDVLNAPNFGQASQRTPNIFGTGGPRAFQFASRLTF
ncbi:MAG: TonB-dependent receptor [Bryobacteraceae bacterium]|jgi:hypothetical protein